MVTLRRLAIFSFLALLPGCGTPCPPPGHPSFTGDTCWYILEVTVIDSKRGEVTGKISPMVPKYAEASEETKNTLHTFRVRDLEMLEKREQLVKNTAYVFTSQYGSPYLEPFPKGYESELLSK